MSPKKVSSKKAKKPWKPDVRTIEEGDEAPSTAQMSTHLLKTLIPDLVKSFPIRILLNFDHKAEQVTEKFLHIDVGVPQPTVSETSRAAEERAGTWKGKGKATAADLISDDSEPEPEPEPEPGSELEPEGRMEALGSISNFNECFECQWRRRERERIGLTEEGSNAPSNDRASSSRSVYHSMPPLAESATSSTELLPNDGRPVPRQFKKRIYDALSPFLRCCCYWQPSQE